MQIASFLATKQPVFGEGISIKLLYYCGEGQSIIDALTIRQLPSFD
ncbi:MAG: hypothetical protein JWQ09_2076 [Segetibacter sp.]|nr:hypothetical protein [Segetibacter sp.]